MHADDTEVRKQLREMGEPMTLFGKAEEVLFRLTVFVCSVTRCVLLCQGGGGAG